MTKYSCGEESDFTESEIAEYKDKPLQQLRNETFKVKNPNGFLRCLLGCVLFLFPESMDYICGQEFDFSESLIAEDEEKPLELLRNGTYKVKHPNGSLRCPFCAGKKNPDFKYKDLLQHALGVGKGSSDINEKQKANHIALAIYLENELADEAEQPQKVTGLAAPSSKESDVYCIPWTGIVVNIIKVSDSGKDVEDTKYWMERFSKYNPEAVEIIWDDQKQSAVAFVRFNNNWTGFMNALGSFWLDVME